LRQIALIALAVAAPALHAQSTFTGRVLSDSGVPLVGAEVVLARLQKAARTGENGEFRIGGLPSGYHIVGIRMPGFAPEGDTIEVADAGEVRREYRMKSIATKLPEVPVSTTPVNRRLTEFDERRRMSIGRFLDSAEFANASGTRTADRLIRFPGLRVAQGRTLNQVTIQTTRQASLRGRWCNASVWVDGVNLGTGFSVNSIDPSLIVGVEWYAGQASVPAQFNTSRPGEVSCAVLVLWTRW
jgi:carboxypeptidase family protein